MADNLFQLRIDPETERKLGEIAHATERNKSATVRWLIHQAWNEIRKQQHITITEQGLAALEETIPERG